MSINRTEQKGCDQKLVQLYVFRFADDLLEIGCFSGSRIEAQQPKQGRRIAVAVHEVYHHLTQQFCWNLRAYSSDHRPNKLGSRYRFLPSGNLLLEALIAFAIVIDLSCAACRSARIQSVLVDFARSVATYQAFCARIVAANNQPGFYGWTFVFLGWQPLPSLQHFLIRLRCGISCLLADLPERFDLLVLARLVMRSNALDERLAVLVRYCFLVLLDCDLHERLTLGLETIGIKARILALDRQLGEKGWIRARTLRT